MPPKDPGTAIETMQNNGITEFECDGRQYLILEPEASLRMPRVAETTGLRKLNFFVGMEIEDDRSYPGIILLTGYKGNRYELYPYPYKRGVSSKIITLQGYYDEEPKSPHTVLNTDCDGEGILVIQIGPKFDLKQGTHINCDIINNNE